MAPIVLTILQIVFLLLLYLFVARAVRAVVRDVQGARAAVPRSAPQGARPRAEQPASRPAPRRESARQTDRSARPPPRELVVHAPEGKPRVVRLDGSPVTLGRGDSATVPLGDSYASDHHARIYQEGEDWFVSDLGSTNGTYLNQSRLSRPTPIAAGDQLALGKTVVEVRR